MLEQIEKNFKANNFNIGYDHRCFVIAEIGNNHNGEFNLAIKLVDAAISEGADAVKFQLKDIETAFPKNLLDSPYNNENSFGSTYREHKKSIELTYEEYEKIKKYCDSKNIIFFATPFEEISFNFLEKINVCLYKIASFHNQDNNLIKKIASSGKPLIVSTGMSTQEEVDNTFNILNSCTKKFALLHCISAYPAEDSDINLLVIKSFIDRYKCIIGYSGHERGINICASSVLLGSKIVEKHFTLDRTMKGTDHALSLEPGGFGFMVQRIRLLEAAMGNSERKLLNSEMSARKKNR